ncbi:MAG: formyltetrahydrofolate deformylase [Pseudomonadota bacterium]|nr:formyltetrahydrofolate deformylase [Pseudomonadota bacterium]
MPPASAVLLITCPDRKGLVAAVADFLYRNGANILHADQHIDADEGLFLMRVEWNLETFAMPLDEFAAAFDAIARAYDMRWRLEDRAAVPRVAIFCSRYDHCLVDLLYRHRSGELHCEIPLVVSNHPDNREITGFFGVAYEEIPVTRETKADAERRQIALLQEHAVDLVVLARYMQILSADFVAHFPARIINIHHSFLPAFLGANPYQRAHERGVKLVGATAHYVTNDLDDGPIIEQDVMRVSHRDQVVDLVEKGRDIEKIVLSRAVRWHLEHRVLVYGNKTVVFD